MRSCKMESKEIIRNAHIQQDSGLSLTIEKCSEPSSYCDETTYYWTISIRNSDDVEVSFLISYDINSVNALKKIFNID